MSSNSVLKIVALLLLATSTMAFAAEGYVRKAGEGFFYFNGITEKVSPESGSEKSILAEQVFGRGDTTGLHIHDQGDEIFYVAKGTGIAHLDGKDYPIGQGDVIFIPRGAIHQMSNPFNDETLVVVFYMDSPELFHQFRAMKKRMENPDPITDEDRKHFRSFGGSRQVQK